MSTPANAPAVSLSAVFVRAPATAARRRCEQIASVRAAAEAAGRPAPEFSVSFRPILGTTEAPAREGAHAILGRIGSNRFFGEATAAPANTGSQRLLAAAATATAGHCGRPPPGPAGRPGNSTAPVGTPGTVVRAQLDHHDPGVTTFLIRGPRPAGRRHRLRPELIRAVRTEIARRDVAGLAVAA